MVEVYGKWTDAAREPVVDFPAGGTALSAALAPRLYLRRRDP
jgi:hypothetical protein